MAFDENSFSKDSFSTNSWLFDLVESVRRLVVRMKSILTRSVSLVSKVD